MDSANLEDSQGITKAIVQQKQLVFSTSFDDPESWPKDAILSEVTRFSGEKLVNYIRKPSLQIENFMSVSSLPEVQGELAALQVKCERLQNELKESKAFHSQRDVRFAELQTETETLREDNARQTARVLALQQRLILGEEELGKARIALQKEQAAVNSLQRQTKELQTRLHDLEDRLKRHLLVREEAEQRAIAADRKLDQTLMRLISLLKPEENSSLGDEERVLIKVNELLRDQSRLQAKVVTIGGALASRQSEVQMNERALSQVMSEVSEKQSEAKSWREKYEVAEEQRAELQQQVTQLQTEVQQLHDHCVSLQQTEVNEMKVSHELRMLRETLAFLLSTADVVVTATDDAIKERMRDIMASEKHNYEEVLSLRTEYQRVEELLSQEKQKYQLLEEELVNTATCVSQHEEQARNLRNDKDSWRRERNQFEDLLNSLAQRLWSGARPVWTTPNEIGDLLIERLDESLREGESRQLELLRKRERTLQGEVQHAHTHLDTLERDHEELNDQAQKLQQEVDRLTRKLKSTNDQLEDKKVQENKLLREVSDLQKKLVDLEKMAMRRFTSAGAGSIRSDRTRPSTATYMKGITDPRYREHKLMDLRSRIIRILGLEIGLEPPSDAFILARLRKLVQSHRHCLSSVVTVKEPNEHAEDRQPLRAVHKH